MEQQIIEIRNISSSTNTDEAFRTLRTNLMYIDDLKVITISSSSPNEGKTVTAFNLAYQFAQLGKRVVLIDADMRRSSLRSYLMLKDKVSGLSEALSRQSRNYLFPTSVDNLFVILSGKNPPNPSELLSSPIFDQLISALKENFDYVIIDTAPMAVSMDATIVGRKSDGLVMVIRNEMTRKKNLRRIRADLERNGVRLVGAVLNRVKKNQIDYGDYRYEKYYE